MKKCLVLTLTIIMSVSLISPIFAQGEATGLFLMINPGARQGGMGEAGVALADDATAIYWNPAGLAFQYNDPEKDNQGEATLMHVNWLPQFNLSDLYYDYAAGRYHLPGVGEIGGSIQFINYGENVQTDTEGNQIGTFNSNEFAFTGSYATKVQDNLGIGVNLKFVYSRLSPVQVDAEKGKGIGTTFAVDFGVLYHPGFAERLSVGANLSNFGPKITFIDKDQADPIPINLRFGLAYRLVDSEYNKLTLIYDINREMVPKDDDKKNDSFLTYL
ncbi:PorV/PorQ family protein, partial [Candidatus Saccharibacteria bacterium]|nr:PorV/PorQ family protein [Calditrichia bacterium]NIV71368.1 PorV/PorQ family protein [Calditrichia bacterium]NIV97884.1 PorV/PorQ family protein [Candidatus Saccharibacteria bacterium]NIW78112.1 PorV/PorQ family protein [Calditrichia bacterium]